MSNKSLDEMYLRQINGLHANQQLPPPDAVKWLAGWSPEELEQVPMSRARLEELSSGADMMYNSDGSMRTDAADSAGAGQKGIDAAMDFGRGFASTLTSPAALFQAAPAIAEMGFDAVGNRTMEPGTMRSIKSGVGQVADVVSKFPLLAAGNASTKAIAGAPEAVYGPRTGSFAEKLGENVPDALYGGAQTVIARKGALMGVKAAESSLTKAGLSLAKAQATSRIARNPWLRGPAEAMWASSDALARHWIANSGADENGETNNWTQEVLFAVLSGYGKEKAFNYSGVRRGPVDLLKGNPPRMRDRTFKDRKFGFERLRQQLGGRTSDRIRNAAESRARKNFDNMYERRWWEKYQAKREFMLNTYGRDLTPVQYLNNKIAEADKIRRMGDKEGHLSPLGSDGTYAQLMTEELALQAGVSIEDFKRLVYQGSEPTDFQVSKLAYEELKTQQLDEWSQEATRLREEMDGLSGADASPSMAAKNQELQGEWEGYVKKVLDKIDEEITTHVEASDTGWWELNDVGERVQVPVRINSEFDSFFRSYDRLKKNYASVPKVIEDRVKLWRKRMEDKPEGWHPSVEEFYELEREISGQIHIMEGGKNTLGVTRLHSFQRRLNQSRDEWLETSKEITAVKLKEARDKKRLFSERLLEGELGEVVRRERHMGLINDSIENLWAPGARGAQNMAAMMKESGEVGSILEILVNSGLVLAIRASRNDKGGINQASLASWMRSRRETMELMPPQLAETLNNRIAMEKMARQAEKSAPLSARELERAAASKFFASENLVEEMTKKISRGDSESAAWLRAVKSQAAGASPEALAGVNRAAREGLERIAMDSMPKIIESGTEPFVNDRFLGALLDHEELLMEIFDGDTAHIARLQDLQRRLAMENQNRGVPSSVSDVGPEAVGINDYVGVAVLRIGGVKYKMHRARLIANKVLDVLKVTETRKVMLEAYWDPQLMEVLSRRPTPISDQWLRDYIKIRGLTGVFKADNAELDRQSEEARQTNYSPGVAERGEDFFTGGGTSVAQDQINYSPGMRFSGERITPGSLERQLQAPYVPTSPAGLFSQAAGQTKPFSAPPIPAAPTGLDAGRASEIRNSGQVPRGGRLPGDARR